ncbi:MAG: GNAT family N-acetyltransferase [Thermoplasmataceae archaeon]
MLRKKSIDPQEYAIREARISDAKGIIECMQSVMDEHTFLVSEYYLLTERGEQDRLRNIEDLTLVLEYGPEIVGVLTLQRGMFKKNHHTASLGIAIKKNHRSMGHGTRLIKSAVEWAKSKGIEKIWLEVFSTNTRAIEVYKKIGFIVEGNKEKQFIIDGNYVDDVLMSYWIG